MSSKWKDMIYNEKFDCWIEVWDYNTGYKVRCGDWLDLHIGEGRKLTCRMELGRQWYVILGPNETKLYLKPNETYKVNVL